MGFRKFISVLVFVTLVVLINYSHGALRRCFVCRSRGDLGSCKDPFTFNETQVVDEKGVEAQPCASGWCGKIVESENKLHNEYGMATERMCLQRGPSDDEERCADTVWNHKKVFMCFCSGDLCNSATPSATTPALMCLSLLLIALNKF